MYQTVYDATVVSFATSSSEVDLSKGWKRVWVEVPTMTSNATIHVQAANTTGGTYRRLVEKDPASAGASVDWSIVSACTGRFVPCEPAAGLRYVKVEANVVLSFTAGFKIVCSDDV